jgi:TolB protein
MKMMNLRLYALLLVVFPSAVFADLPTLQVSGANFRPMPVALAPPTATADIKAAATDFDSALLFDLTAAGIFQVLERKSFLADAKEGFSAAAINFTRWADVGAEALIKVQLTQEGGNLKGELKVFDVSSAREDFKTDGSLPVGQGRKLAHQFADALFKHFTREPGPFQNPITFVRKGAGTRDVYVADWDGKNARAVSTGGLNLLPTLFKDLVAFTSYKRGKPEIFVSRGGGGITPLIATNQMATGIAFSPDGRRVAYSLAQGEGAQIYVANADGSGAKSITDTNYQINSSPTWSPDGKRIAFVSNRGGSPQVYVMNADGSGVKRLTFQGNYNQTPDWSPRGDLIAFTARDERNAFDLFTVNVENGKITRLTQDQGNNEEPSFSSNGRLILFTTNRGGGSNLWVMTANGEHQVALPADKGVYQTPAWGR